MPDDCQKVTEPPAFCRDDQIAALPRNPVRLAGKARIAHGKMSRQGSLSEVAAPKSTF